MDNFCCKMSKITKTMKNGLQLWVQKVTWAGTQCSEFFSQARLILCQCMNNFAALVLNCFYVLNILIRIAWTSLIVDMPLSGAYNQNMAAIRLLCRILLLALVSALTRLYWTCVESGPTQFYDFRN